MAKIRLTSNDWADDPISAAEGEDWSFGPPTIADIIREKAAANAQAEQPPTAAPATPDWVGGIDPAILEAPSWTLKRAGVAAGIEETAADPALSPGSTLSTALAGMGATEITMMQAKRSPAGKELVNEIMARRRRVYARAQSLFGFSAQNVDIALARADISWESVSGASDEQLRSLLHGPIAGEFFARGGKMQMVGPGGEEDVPYYYAPRAVESMSARPEGDVFSTQARLVPGAAGATLGQSWALQRGVTPEQGQRPELGPQQVYRGESLITGVEAPLQEAGVAGVRDPEGQVTGWVTASPEKAAKRQSQVMQEFGVSLTGLETVQSNVLGQMATIPETVQVADAWISMGEWMPQGSAMLGKSAGRASRVMTRKVRLPEGETLTVKAGETYGPGKPVRLFGSHVGYDWSKDFEQVVVQQAEIVKQYDSRTGKPYNTIMFQAVGVPYSGTLTALKHWSKGGAALGKVATEMGVDAIVAANELYQTGAAVASVASPEEMKEIWGVEGGTMRWGPESGKQFAKWLLGPDSQLEERLLPAQTFDLSDPTTLKLIELGRLVNPKTGEPITQESVKQALIPGKGEAISAQVLDVGLGRRIGVKASQVFAGSTSLLKMDALEGIAEHYPRQAALMIQRGLGHQQVMSHLAAAVAANVEPGSEVGSVFIEKAIPAEQIGRLWPQFAEKASDLMREAGYKDPTKTPQVLQSLIMSLVGEAFPGRGVAFEGAEGATRYFPNPQTLSRTFGYPFEEYTVGDRKQNVLNQLPATVSHMLEYESRRTLRGEEFIPEDMIPEGKTPADFTEDELREMAEKHRAGTVETAFKDFLIGTSTKEKTQSLMGVSTRRMVGPHPTAVLGTPLTKYITSERILTEMLRAATPGAKEEDIEELRGLVTGGKLPGPELIVAGYPIVDPEQTKVALSYMTPKEAVGRKLASSREEVNELFGGRIGVSQLVAYMQEKDWDVDEFLRMVKGRYSKRKGEWHFDPLGKAPTEGELKTMLRETSISGEATSATEKMGKRSSLGGVQAWIREGLEAPVLPFEEFQRQSEEKVTGGRIKGMAYNVMLRNIQGRMRGPSMAGGHEALAAARRSMAVPFQTALDLKKIEGGWGNIIERLYSFNLATMGWRKGGLYGEGGPENYLKTGITGYMDATIQDVLGLTGMEDKAIKPEHLAASLVSPAVDEERWGKLTEQIGKYQAGERGGLVGDIRESVYGGLKAGPRALQEERSGALRELHARSPLLSVGLEAAAYKAVRAGTAGIGKTVWRKTARGGYKGASFGPEKAWLAEQGEMMRESIQAQSPLTHLGEEERLSKWNLWERLKATARQATTHSFGHPARATQATRAMNLARGPREGTWEDFIARQGVSARATPVEMMAPQGSGLEVLQQMLGAEKPVVEPSPTPVTEGPAPAVDASTDLRSRIAALAQTTFGFDPSTKGSAAKAYQFVLEAQQARREVGQSPLRKALNQLLGGLPREERAGATGIWQEEIGKYGLMMAEGKGGMYHQYQEFLTEFQEFGPAQKFTNPSDQDPADTPAFVTKKEASLLQKMESKRVPPQAVESAISKKPSSSERFAAITAEFATMPEEEQAAYRARYSILDPNKDTFGPSFAPFGEMSMQEVLEARRAEEKARQAQVADEPTPEGLGLLGETVRALTGSGEHGLSFYGRQTAEGEQFATIKPLGPPTPQFTQMQHFMATQFMTQLPGMEETEFLRGVSGLGLEGVAPGLERLRTGKLPTAGQMGRLEGLLGISGADIALSLKPPPAEAPLPSAAKRPQGATEEGYYSAADYGPASGAEIGAFLGRAPSPEPPSRFEQLQRMSRPSREDVVTALAGGEISKKQAVGFLRGKGQMEMTSEVRGILQEVSEVGPTYRDVGPVVQKGLAALGAAGPTDQAVVALEKFSESLVSAREDLDKYGDIYQEQIEDYKKGKIEVTPEWQSDVAKMIAQAQGITGAAAALPGGVPVGQRAEVGRWAGLLGQARGAGLAPRPLGAGFAGAGPPGGLRGLMGGMIGPEGKGPMGTEGPFRGTENVFSQLTDYWKMFRMQRIWGMTGGAVMGQIPVAAQQEQAASRAAMATMPMGQGGAGRMTLDLMSYGAQRQAWQAQVGRVAHGAWGWTQQGALGEGTATAAGIGGFAAGVGAVAGIGAQALIPGIAATAVGIPVAAAVALIGGTVYAMDTAGDEDRMALALAGGGSQFEQSMASLRYGVAPAGEEPRRGGPRAPRVRTPQEQISPEAQAQQELGTQIRTGALEGLTASQRGVAIQEAVTRATAEDQPLSAFEQPMVSGALEQWYAYTPGAAQQAPSEILEDPRFAAMMMRGTGPQTYAQIGGQWGMEPGRWGEVQEMMGRVSQPVAQDLLFAAGQYAPLQRFMPREQILENVMQPRGAVTGWEAAGAVQGMEQGLQQPGVQQWDQMTGEQALQVERLGAMDPMAWSRLGMYGGEIGATGVQVQPGTRELITRDPGTGMTIGRDWGGGILAQGIQGGEFPRISELAQEAFQMADITITAENATVQVGGYQAPLTQIGLQDLSTRMQRGEREYQRGLQGEALAVQYAYTTGGALGGVPAAAGAQQFMGRGQWQIQNEMTTAQRGYQETQFGFQWEQLGMQDQQFQQRWGLSQQRFQAQAQWGQEDLGTQYGRRMTQFGWAEENLQFQGAKGAMQYGWQMGDVEENLRYATGRQRRGLMKQRERATISYGMQMGQLETEEGRLDTRREWAEEDYQRDEERFEIRMGWSEEELNLQMEHHEQNMDLARRRLTESERYYHELVPLQDEMRDTSRALWEYNIGKQVESLQHAIDLAAQLDIVQDLLTGIAQSQEATLTEFSAAFSEDGIVTKAFESFAEGVAQPFGPGGYVLNEIGNFSGVFYSMLAGATAMVSGYNSIIHNDPYDIRDPDKPGPR